MDHLVQFVPFWHAAQVCDMERENSIIWELDLDFQGVWELSFCGTLRQSM